MSYGHALKTAGLQSRAIDAYRKALQLDPAVLREAPGGDERAAGHVVVLRHTLMNPWLLDEANGVNYIDLYCDYLAGLVRAELAEGGRAIAAA